MELENPKAVPEMAPVMKAKAVKPGTVALPEGIAVPAEKPRFASRIETTPDTDTGRVKIHMELYDGVQNPIKGTIALDADQATKLAAKLHKDAAFVRRYAPKRKK